MENNRDLEIGLFSPSHVNKQLHSDCSHPSSPSVAPSSLLIVSGQFSKTCLLTAELLDIQCFLSQKLVTANSIPKHVYLHNLKNLGFLIWGLCVSFLQLSSPTKEIASWSDFSGLFAVMATHTIKKSNCKNDYIFVKWIYLFFFNWLYQVTSTSIRTSNDWVSFKLACLFLIFSPKLSNRVLSIICIAKTQV